jgi:hypothetical protein
MAHPGPYDERARAVAPDAFGEWIASHVGAIRDFRDGHRRGTRALRGLRRAMTERAEEQNYCKRSPWERLITDTHMFGAMTLRAVSDYLRVVAELFDSGHPPLYARRRWISRCIRPAE